MAPKKAKEKRLGEKNNRVRETNESNGEMEDSR